MDNKIFQEFTFVKKSRFLLKSNLYEITNFIRSVDVDYIKKELKFSMYDVDIGINKTLANEWSDLANKFTDNMTLTFFDGCGKEIYKVIFNQVKLLGHTISLDHNSNEVLVHEFSTSFSDCDVKNGSDL